MFNRRPGTRLPQQRPASDFGGTGSQTATDHVVRFSEVVNSSLNTRTKAVHYSLVGIGDPNAPNDPALSETMPNADVYAAPGIIGRPLPPRRTRAGDEHMDVLALATADGLVPFGFRDMRLKMGGNAPAEGVLAFVGYGGGFHSMTPVTDPDPSGPGKDPRNPDPAGGGTIHVLYCPYDFDANGVPQKAHAIVMDPTQGNESVMMIHGDGLALTMSGQDKKALTLKNAAGDATFRLDDDGITMTAKQIVLSGGVVIGEPASAVPLLPGVASPGSTKLWVSP